MRSLQILLLSSPALARPAFFYPYCTTHTDNFDRLAASSVSTQTWSVGNHHGLEYRSFYVDQEVHGRVGGVTPQSAPNAATAPLQDDIQTFGYMTVYPFGSVSSGLGTSYFNLHSFHFGCSVDGKAHPCNIIVTGFDYKDNFMPEEPFTYDPSSTSDASMTLAQLPLSWNMLTTITFGILTYGEEVAEGITLHIDNLVHCDYS